MTYSPPTPTALTEGSIIGKKYRLESLLGEGGMGSVWRAFNVQLEVPVAIKVLRADLAASELGERLRVEARAAAKLVHPSIVRVFDIGETETNDPFIVMELLNGESLGSRLEREPLSAATTLQLMLPIAEALSLAHSRGVVHRDLKPDNIFLATEGSGVQPKLLDFGIAKLTSSLEGGPTLTQSGTLLGSPEYMSPEQAYARADIDERSDVWAFCVVLYEALSGSAPFGGDSNAVILRSVVQDRPAPLELIAKVDPTLAALVHWGLAKEREKRPSSIFELGRQLAAWLVAHGIHHDVTGSLLDTKWLGPNAELNAPGSSSPHARHDHATLVSVVKPSPPPSDAAIELDFEVPALRRSKRWLAIGAAAAALLIAGGWAVSTQAAGRDRLAGVALPAAMVTPPATAHPASSAPEIVLAPSAVPERHSPPAEAPSAPSASHPPTVGAPPSAAATLPRALPRSPGREKRTDLLNP
ncbi:MAG TPA: protein kinase, partial [Polyangiaceae bacterium]|nr:protein kinase [Polyangiaceae bacterium]